MPGRYHEDKGNRDGSNRVRCAKALRDPFRPFRPFRGRESNRLRYVNLKAINAVGLGASNFCLAVDLQPRKHDYVMPWAMAHGPWLMAKLRKGE